MEHIEVYEAMAKLDLPGAERQWVSGMIDRLTGDYAALAGIDTDDVEPLVTVLDVQNVFREDRVEKALPRDQLLRNAPESYDGYFQAPRTLD